MPDESTMICYCHDVTLGQLARYIKEHKISTIADILANTDFVCGDTCENCREEGYNNDGISIAMAIGMVKRGYI
ncbi:MAG: (2Fe-2S)-binding protein [Campylobacterales bacterium]|nr:(2Fe-2S)-binding protein [Campylobacterales bacterium]